MKTRKLFSIFLAIAIVCSLCLSFSAETTSLPDGQGVNIAREDTGYGGYDIHVGNWHLWKSDFNMMYDAATGAPIYCINAKEAAGSSGTIQNLEMNTYFRKQLSSVAQNGITLAVYYGYPVSILGTGKYPAYTATQIVIWEYQMGCRSDASAINSPWASFMNRNPEIRTAYENLLTKIRNHKDRTYFNNGNITLSGIGSQYAQTVTDLNGIADNLTWTASNPNVKTSVNGNQMTIWCTGDFSGTVTVSGRRTLPETDAAGRPFLTLTGITGANQEMIIGTPPDPTERGRITVNLEAKGALSVKKTDPEGNPLSGVIFGVYTDADCITKIAAITTGNDGTAVYGYSSGTYSLPANKTYYVKELQAKDNTWHIDNTVYSASVTPNTIVAVNNGNAVINEHKMWRVNVTKADKTGTVSGGCSLSGAVYGLYDRNNNLVKSYTTNTKGQFTTDLLVAKTGYYLKEITAPEGYLIDSRVYYLDEFSNPATLTNVLTESNIKLEESPIQGTVSIHKLYEESKDNYLNEQNAAFQIYSAKYKSYEEAVENGNSNEYDSCITNKYGVGIWSNKTEKSKPLSYGKYIITQTDGAFGTFSVEDFEVMISEHNKDYHYELKNRQILKILNIQKIDAESGEMIVRGPTKFKIQNLISKEYLTHTVDGKETDIFETKDGYVALRIPYGAYALIEIEAPYGYQIAENPLRFSVHENSGMIQNFKNNPAKGIIEIHKLGSQFTGIELSETEFGTVHKPVFEEKYLASIVFELSAAEDILAGDGRIIHHAGDIIETIETVSDNPVNSQPLYVGKYLLKEISGRPGYIVNPKEYPIEITNDGSSEIQITTITITNDKVKTEIHAIKKSVVFQTTEDDGNIRQSTNIIPGEDFIFGLFTDEDLTTLSGEIIKKDELVSIAKTDKEGNLNFAEDLPFGHYYVKELKAPEDRYLLSEKKYPVDLSAEIAGENDITVEIEEEILNDFPRYLVTITKTDLATGQPVPGAVIEIKDQNNNILYREITGEDGTLPNITLEPGVYTFKETIAPDGYVLNTENFTFEIDTSGKVIGTTVIKNEQTRFTIHKTDEDNNPLPDVEFTMYDEFGRAIATTVTDKDGIAVFMGFKKGNYMIRETKTPDGYEPLDQDIRIDNDGIWENEAQYSSIEIQNRKIVIPDKIGSGDGDFKNPITSDSSILFPLLALIFSVALAITAFAMKKGKKPKMFSSLLILIFLFTVAFPSLASEEIQKSETFKTDSKEFQYDFPEETKESGITYQLKDITYSEISHETKQKSEEVFLEISHDQLLQEKNFSAPQTLMQSETTYTLNNVTYEKIRLTNRSAGIKSSTTTYRGQTSQPENIPETKEITVFDPVQEINIPVTLPLIEVTAGDYF